MSDRGVCKTVAISVILLLASGAASAAHPEKASRPTYQGVSLEPGDVINFHGGIVTTGNAFTYGHTALYLGRDRETGNHTFLDFSITKGGPLEIVFGTPRAFFGRILTEDEFLRYNAPSHGSFDVFQLRDRSAVNERELVAAAQRIAAGEWYGPFGEVCSSAVAATLSAVTKQPVNIITPNGFVKDDAFQRHPALIGKTINMQAAIRELERRAPRKSVVGTWHGTATQPGEPAYDVVMTLSSAREGSTNYPSLNCGGALSVVNGQGDSYSYRETISRGGATADTGGCIDGTVAVRLIDEQTLSWSWVGTWQGTTYTASATLTRSAGQ